MRLAAKLVLLFLVGLLLIVGLFSYLTIQQDKRLALAEHQRYASDLAATLQPSIQEAMHGNHKSELQQVISRSTRQFQHVRVRWLELNSRQVGPAGSGDPAGSGGPLDVVVAKREVTTIVMPDRSGQEVFYTYVPIVDDTADAKPAGSIEVSAPNRGASERLLGSLRTSLLAMLGVTTLSGIVILVGGIMMVGKPLNELIDKVQRVGQGDFSGPVQLRSADELGRLGNALNEMCDQLEEQRYRLNAESASRIATLEQLRHADRLNTVGRMAAGIAHEMGTPLNVVTGRAELIAGGQLTEEATRESARAIQHEGQRIAKIIRELLDFARQSTPNRSQCSLKEVIQVTANLMRPLASKHGAEIQVELPSQPCDAEVDAAQIQQVLTNLIVNAVQATGDHGLVTITLTDEICRRVGEPESAQRVYRKIEIRDNGAGISKGDREHIFEPFYTTKEVGDGTGLGLSISHGIVHEHDGWITVDSEVGRGSCFSVYLPVASESEEASDE